MRKLLKGIIRSAQEVFSRVDNYGIRSEVRDAAVMAFSEAQEVITAANAILAHCKQKEVRELLAEEGRTIVANDIRLLRKAIRRHERNSVEVAQLVEQSPPVGAVSEMTQGVRKQGSHLLSDVAFIRTYRQNLVDNLKSYSYEAPEFKTYPKARRRQQERAP
jgi:hypothetical protein